MREEQRDPSVGESEARIHDSGPMQGRVSDAPPAGTTPSHDRPSFADPVPGNMDPTAPDSPENTVLYDRENVANDGARVKPESDSPQDNLERWRVVDAGPGT